MTCIVIKSGQHLNHTLASIKFTHWGEPRDINYKVVDQWEDGFAWASTQSSYALFIKSGTVFSNFDQFTSDLANYPHQGLVGHIIDPLDSTPCYLDDQCFFLELDKFEVGDFTNTSAVVAVRSEQNIHDNYTPIWLRPSDQTMHSDQFGVGLIAKQLSRKLSVMNFMPVLRQHKHYLYSDVELNDWLLSQQDYMQLAENQFWIFNNEPVYTIKSEKFIGPASGLFWIFNIIQPHVTQAHLIDISAIQIKFALHVWNNWDGTNYGKFVSEFIQANGIDRYQLDNPDLTKLDFLKLKKSANLIEYIDSVFAQYYTIGFVEQWNLAKSKSITFTHGDLVKILPTLDLTNTEVWSSNVLDYKYTLLHNTKEEVELYQNVER